MFQRRFYHERIGWHLEMNVCDRSMVDHSLMIDRCQEIQKRKKIKDEFQHAKPGRDVSSQDEEKANNNNKLLLFQIIWLWNLLIFYAFHPEAYCVILLLSSFHIQRLILRGEGQRSPEYYIKNGKYGVFKVDIVHLFLNGKPTSCDSMNSQSFLYLCCIILEVQRQLYGFCANTSHLFR